jgi:hypothetical protein
MQLSFSVVKKRPSPTISSINIEVPIVLKFETENNGIEEKVAFKVKLDKLNVQVFLLDDKNNKVEEIEKIISVGTQKQMHTVNLRLVLIKKPIKPTDVDLLLFVKNDEKYTKSMPIICY